MTYFGSKLQTALDNPKKQTRKDWRPIARTRSNAPVIQYASFDSYLDSLESRRSA